MPVADTPLRRISCTALRTIRSRGGNSRPSEALAAVMARNRLESKSDLDYDPCHNSYSSLYDDCHGGSRSQRGVSRPERSVTSQASTVRRRGCRDHAVSLLESDSVPPVPWSDRSEEPRLN